MIDTGVNDRIEKLLKLALSSDKDGEVVAATRAIRRTLESAGTDIHEFAERTKGGELSEADMKHIYDTGVQDGKDAAAAAQGFRNTEGPSYFEMAQYCVAHANGRLSAKEQGFVEDMERWCARRKPSEKQGKWLHALYVRLGRWR
jgi:hypothetical protein